MSPASKRIVAVLAGRQLPVTDLAVAAHTSPENAQDCVRQLVKKDVIHIVGYVRTGKRGFAARIYGLRETKA